MKYAYEISEKEPVVFDATPELAECIEKTRLSYNEELVDLMIGEEVFTVEVKDLYVVN